ncbi:MAG: YggT family protein [Cyanobacteria bacterium P01_H01_bin.162]
MPYPPDPPPSRQPSQYPPPGQGADPDPWKPQPTPAQERQRLAQEAAIQAKAEKLTLLDKFVRGVIYLVGALEVLLSLRFLLRLTAANPDNTFANVIYGLSQPFVDPFSTLFVSPTFNGSANIFDVNLLVAMAAYLALLSLFLGLIHVFTNR